MGSDKYDNAFSAFSGVQLSIDGAKALELATFDAAICDYSMLSNAEISQYLKAVQGKIPADARTFKRAEI